MSWFHHEGYSFINEEACIHWKQELIIKNSRLEGTIFAEIWIVVLWLNPLNSARDAGNLVNILSNIEDMRFLNGLPIIFAVDGIVFWHPL